MFSWKNLLVVNLKRLDVKTNTMTANIQLEKLISRESQEA
jgi:hypothetical protein